MDSDSSKVAYGDNFVYSSDVDATDVSDILPKIKTIHFKNEAYR